MLFVTRNGLAPLVTLLGRKDDELLLLVTKAIFYIVQWERARTMALGIGVLEPLFSLLKCSHKNVVQNAVSSISELASYGKSSFYLTCPMQSSEPIYAK